MMGIAIARIKDLIIKHLKEEITDEEHQELQAWIYRSSANATLFNQLTDAASLEELLKESDVRASILKKIEARLADDQEYFFPESKVTYLTPVRRNKTWHYAAAACLLLFTGSYFWFTHSSNPTVAARPAISSMMSRPEEIKLF